MNRDLHFQRILALSLGLGLAACGGGGDDDDGGGGTAGSIAGSLSVLQSSSSILEAEPNGTPAQAHFLGEIGVGSSLTVLGNVTDGGGADSLDSFRVVASLRETITVNLSPMASGGSADFDFFVADPISFQAIEVFQQTGTGPESGTFTAQGSFYIVVVMQGSASADYELEISSSAAPSPVPEVEPNNAAGEAQYLGELAAGAQVITSGSLDGAGSDFADRYLIAVPGGGTLNVAAAFTNTEDFDIQINDVTGGLGSGVLIADLDSGNLGTEQGQATIPAMTLVEVIIYPFMTAAGDYEMSLGLTSPRLAGAAPLSVAPRGSLTESRLRVRAPQAERFFDAAAWPLFVVGDVLVDGPVDAEVDALLTRRGAVVESRVPAGVRRIRFDLPANLTAEDQARYTVALAASLDSDPATRYAELNLILQPLGMPAPLPNDPNDPLYNLQWHYDLIQLPAAWDITTGDNSIIVAVLDTGSTPALDLAPRNIAGIDMISDPGVAGDGNGRDADPTDVGDSNGPQNSSFHGSHVAGTVGGVSDNAYGAAGVTWAGAIMHVRVLGIGGGSLSDISDGILYAAGLANSSGQLPPNAAHVINMSLGGPGTSQTMQAAVTAARNAGTVIIAAAGNDNSGDQFVPASLDGVVSVSAVDFNANKAPYSNFHPTVDICAPGGDVTADRNGDGFADGVLSHRPTDTASPTNFETFELYQGTSMAAPHVAGVAALMLAVDPNLTVQDVETILADTATDRGAPGRDNIYGEGLVNAFAAVQMAAGGGGGMPALNLATTSILLTTTQTSLSVAVANVGGGLLEVTNVAATSTGNWLSATPTTISNPTTTDTSAIAVVADATGLPDGNYAGNVQVTSNGGSANISVVLAVGTQTGTTAAEVFVIAVEVDTLVTVAQDVVNIPGSLAYTLGQVPAGRYIVVAGTDANNDGFICDEGEPLCGIYPTVESPVILELAQAGTLNGINFPLSESFAFGASTGGGSAGANGGRGYALLPTTPPQSPETPQASNDAQTGVNQ